jgi:PEP-CTERM motif
MMMKYLACTAAAMFALLASDAARATPIDVTVGPPGTLSPSDPSAIVLTFDDLAVGSLPLYQFSGGALSGSGAIENTSLVGKYAQPAGDTTNYLTVSYPTAAGAVQLAFSSPENYFGLFWGSLDSYNTITFLRDQGQIATFSGDAIADLTGLVAGGEQQSPLSNRYVNFYLGAAFYDEVVLSTSNFAFEVDNIAFGDPPVPVSEPGTLMLLGSALYGLFIRRRRST